MELHKEHFRGTFNPPELYKLVANGKITALGFLLLGIIESLVSEEEGCWASNAYLGKRAHKSAVRVRHEISKLIKIGVLKQIGWKNVGNNRFRVLETCWSRQVKNEREVKNDHTPLVKNDHTPLVKNDQQSIRIRLNSKRDDILDAGASRVRVGPTSFNGQVPIPEKCSPLDREVAVRIKKMAVAANQFNPRRSELSKWMIAISRITKSQPKEEVLETLTWLEANVGKEFVPEVFCGRSFADKYSAVRRAMKRTAKKMVPIKRRQETDLGNGRTQVRYVTEMVPEDHPDNFEYWNKLSNWKKDDSK